MTSATPSSSSRKGFPFLAVFAWLFALGALAAALLIGGVLVYYSSQVPDFRALTDYKPALITKVYDRNGELVAEFARERRIWVPISQVPKPVVQAFLAAEDTHFFEHGGYDLKAIVRAAVMNALTNRMQGASTITQQVAKTFFLTPEKKYDRKIKELILSWRIEKAFTKNEILELYLNRIYLGNGSYGVAAAAQTYFSKSLDELTLPERAFIAGLPQAPTRYNPVRNPSAAKARRDIVLRRMEAENFITKDEADAAVALPLTLNLSPLKDGRDAPHFTEYVRRVVEQEYGTDALYQDGLTLYTTVDVRMQKMAEEAVYKGLRAYDRRHGWRGPLTRLKTMDGWEEQIGDLDEQYAASWRVGYPAVVLKTAKDGLTVGLAGGQQGHVAWSTMRWTGKGSPQAVAKPGDVVMVKPVDGKADAFALEQLPKVQGALVAEDVRTGEVLAMVGGLGEGGGFNRAIQARRQVGSAFKPFVYAAALEKGYTPASTVLDAPVVFKTGDTEWKPQNYDNKIGGMTTLRHGLERSRNLMTVRLAQDIGLRPVSALVKRLGVSDPVPIVDLSVSLGTLSFSLLDVTSAYAVFPRGGLYVKPSFITRVQDAQGVTLKRLHPACAGCLAVGGAKVDKVPEVPPLEATQALSPGVAYQMVSMMQGVIQNGTGYALRKLGRPIAGKTGTTNDFIDAWFVGFSPSIALGVWVGMDTPASLGHGETGALAAIPIWEDFMGGLLKDMPYEDFAVPESVEFVRIDADSGLLPGPGTRRTISEAFVSGTAPTQITPEQTDDFYVPLGDGESGDGEAGSKGGKDDGSAIQKVFNAFGIY